ncbi:MAG: hypothetical protein ABSH05_27675, partial [Bryobacteraceae bacterium]
MNKEIWVGVDIGGTKTAVVLSSQPPAVMERVEFPTLAGEGPARALDLIKKGIGEALAINGLTSRDI